MNATKVLLAGICLVCLAGCAPKSATTATQAVVPSVTPVTPTTISKGVEPGRLNAKTDPKQLKALSANAAVMETYLAEVDREVLNLVGRYGIPGMDHYGLRKPFVPDRDGHYSLILWAKPPPSRDTTTTVRCYVWTYEGSRNVALNPTLWIGKKAHGMSFHWYINTGDKDLDKKIEKIAIDAANII